MFTRTGTALLLSLALLTGCSTPVPQNDGSAISVENLLGDPARFGVRPMIPHADDLFSLDEAQQQELQQYLQRRRPFEKPHRSLYRYLESITQGFDYRGDTFTAAQALEKRRGNCLTLAILTTALARYTGIDIGYQLVNDLPVYQIGSNVVAKGVHVRTKLFDPEWAKEPGTLVLFRPGLMIDYFPSGRERFIANIEPNEFVAMYYRNIAAEALESNELDKAYWYVLEALQHDSNSAESINYMAVIHRKIRDHITAEALYQHGIAHAENKLSLLKNYHILLTEQGRVREARQIELQLNSLEDPSPYHWFQLAQEAMADGDLNGAIRYFNRALDHAPYLHEAWLGMAQARLQAGELVSAKRAMLEALDRAGRVSTREMYKAKLLSIQDEMRL